MKHCLECRIPPLQYYGQKDHEGKIFHILKCPQCSKSVYSYKSINAVKLAWGLANRQPEPYMILAELEAENNRLKQEILDYLEIIQGLTEKLERLS